MERTVSAELPEDIDLEKEIRVLERYTTENLRQNEESHSVAIYFQQVDELSQRIRCLECYVVNRSCSTDPITLIQEATGNIDQLRVMQKQLAREFHYAKPAEKDITAIDDVEALLTAFHDYFYSNPDV